MLPNDAADGSSPTPDAAQLRGDLAVPDLGSKRVLSIYFSCGV